MFNLQSLTKQTVCRLLTLAIIFCLSGMANVFCCLTKCQIVPKQHLTATQSSDSSCHETATLTSKSDCCSIENREESSESLCSEDTENTTDIALQSKKDDGQADTTLSYLKGSSCQMKCCLPSDEVVDITRVPRLDNTIEVNNLHLAFSTYINKRNVYLSSPVEKLPDQEKTYLLCCVFLI